jgi:pimeloyl-ACP methyl ester carboxylesterase
VNFPGHSGATLAARLDLPNGPVRAYALFAHCFTRSKDLAAVRRIAAELAPAGIALLRFDFTGLGSSEGKFSATDFSSNVADLVSAADYMRRHFEAPSVLIGRSLGGAAVLSASKQVPETRAVVTIGGPRKRQPHVEPRVLLRPLRDRGRRRGRRAHRRAHVQDQQAIRRGRASRAAFARHRIVAQTASHHAPPRDKTVGIAKHLKSFISLDAADRLLSNPADAAFAG